ncbi:hypothetical protein [Aeromicrobium sp. IC_218]|uniref:hypothetical protein n=1 Tax=Aeromicrobium sp. IC_218 TaxID=2545468 RepID=UPI0010390483|nr:hypothetical protein [Aeromicrobium sp. IC_218]TCJ00099.1 hypothetical protein E0W78_02525 [Aeromicrobium sp. IC_218]
MIEYVDRAKTLPAPPHVVWDDLVDPRTTGLRPWLVLEADEVPPRVVASERPRLVVWSSLWTARPDDVVTLELSRAGAGSTLRVRVVTPHELPGEDVASHVRRRLGQLLYGELRLTYGA